MFGKKKRERGASLSNDPVRQRLLRLGINEMPAIERESAKSIYFALQRDPEGDTAQTILDTFLSSLLITESSQEPETSPAVALFRSEFVTKGRRWAQSSSAEWNGILHDMSRITRARVTQSADPQQRAVLCATHLFAFLAYDASEPTPTFEEVFAGATEAVDATVPRVETRVDITNGPGPTLLRELRESMGIDEWSEQIRRGFKWTHGQLSTTFTATLVDVKPGLPIWEVSVKTPIVTGAVATGVPPLVAELNEGAGGDALVFEADDGTISTVMTVAIHHENEQWMTRLAKLLVMASIDLAESRSDLLASATGGQVSLGRHGTLGARTDRDPILGVVDSENWPTGPPPGDEEFWSNLLRQLQDATRGTGTSSESGLSIEIGGQAILHQDSTLLTIGSEDGVFWHEQSAAARMGPGITFRCGLPDQVESPAEIANQLNLLEPDSHPSRLGAWYTRDAGLWLTARVPSAALPQRRDDAGIVIFNLAATTLGRARAARDWIQRL